MNTSAPLGVRNYVGRSIPDPADPTRRLYYYHHVLPAPGDPPPGSLSAIKYLEADADGTPTLRYAPLLEPFTGRAVRADAPLGPDQPLALLAEDAADGIFEATVNVPYAGICFRMERGADGVPHGLAAWLAPSHAGDTNLVVMLGTVRFPNGRTGQRPYFGGPLALARLASGASDFPLRLRVVCRDAFADVYVDDVLRISYTFDAAHQPGGAGAGAFTPVFRRPARSGTSVCAGSSLIDSTAPCCAIPLANGVKGGRPNKNAGTDDNTS